MDWQISLKTWLVKRHSLQCNFLLWRSNVYETGYRLASITVTCFWTAAYTGWIWKNTLWLLLIFEQCSMQVFLHKILHNSVKQQHIHLYHQVVFKYIWKRRNYTVSTETLPFLRVLSVVFTGNLLIAPKRVCLSVMRWGCRLGDGQSYCRCSKWALLVAIVKQSNDWYEVRHRLVDVIVFLWQLFLIVCSAGRLSTYQSS